MEAGNVNLNIEGPYPVLVIPKVCTNLETNYEMSENLFIHLNIQSPDTDGNETLIYNGICNLKVTEGEDNKISYSSSNNTVSNNLPIIYTEANEITFPVYNDPQVWIDPSRSPYVYNHCDTSPCETYTIMEGPENHITIEQHNTYITQNVYNCNEPSQFSPISDEPSLVEEVNEPIQKLDYYNIYEEDEFECGVFLSQLSEEIINEKEMRAREERNFIGLQTEDGALNQLMSSNIQSVSRQQKTILFLGHNADSGQTIQNISINDPALKCIVTEDEQTAVVLDECTSSNSNLRTKKYQCNKCKKLFDRLSTFKQHMVVNHRFHSPYDIAGNVRYICADCGKNLKNKEKFEQHCLAHGDPELECDKCHKVYASKMTLRNHRKIHERMFPCGHCVKSYSTSPELYSHTAKSHGLYMCDLCTFSGDNLTELRLHGEKHKTSDKKITESEGDETLSDISALDTLYKYEKDFAKRADAMINKLMSDDLNQSNNLSNRMRRKYNKSCEVCLKKFDRISDLKRHLIEHVIQNTLAKNPVNKYGVLNIRCEICREKVFNKIDKYKAHLREHAKLTLYKCTFCDKSFSDSSNFSKHKKIHGNTFYQCDICQRKFNSRKMIIQHIEYHNRNRPLKCQYCDRVFYFKSMLNKHMKTSHIGQDNCYKFRCRFCRTYCKSLKEKWDHEWQIHNVRKVIVDCLLCGSQFRKYAELKKHCLMEHDTAIPAAKRLLRWKLRNKVRIINGE